MRNLKKMAALGAAAVMALSMNVSAFAAATSTAKASYSGGKVLLDSLADIDATHQWTVVVIDVADQNANLTADKLYYINQGTSGDTFWTSGMGTKTELAAGDYIVRIGGETIDTADKLIEIPLKVASSSTGKEVTITIGDVNGVDGVNTVDANYILAYLAGGSAAVGGAYSINETVTDVNGNSIVFGDVNGADGVNTVDANYVLAYLAGGSANVGGAAGINETYTITVPAE